MAKLRVRISAPSRPVPTVVPLMQPNSDDIVTTLKNMLEHAERGEFQSIAIAASRHDGGISTTYSLGRGLFSLLGALAVVDDRLRREING